MSDPYLDEFDIERRAAAGGVESLADDLRRALGREPNGAFRDARDFSFTNSTADVRDWLSTSAALLEGECPNFPALYTEMNGFDINPDRWFADLFAWRKPIPDDGTPGSWPGSNVDCPSGRGMITLTGAERMQAAFAQNILDAEAGVLSPALRRASELAGWLVWSEWLTLLKAAWDEGPIAHIRVPLAATAHDFDLVLRLQPPA